MNFVSVRYVLSWQQQGYAIPIYQSEMVIYLSRCLLCWDMKVQELL